MWSQRRRTFLAGAAVALAGCAGRSNSSPNGPGGSTTDDLDSGTEPPPEEYIRPRVRRDVYRRLLKKRQEYGYPPLDRNDALRGLAQERAKAAAEGESVESEGARLRRIDCENGGEIVAVVPLGSPVRRPGNESGTTVIESRRDLAAYLGEYWMQPGDDRQTLLTGSFSRVGIGSYVGDQEQQIAVAASLCE